MSADSERNLDRALRSWSRLVSRAEEAESAAAPAGAPALAEEAEVAIAPTATEAAAADEELAAATERRQTALRNLRDSIRNAWTGAALPQLVARYMRGAPMPDITAMGRRAPDHGTAPPSGEQQQCICCAQRNCPIATAAELLPEQIARLESASYPYQLDLLGNEECWVYSATNPNNTRFDVARFGGAACKRVRLLGSASDEHSFFPPYAWRMACCARWPSAFT